MTNDLTNILIKSVSFSETEFFNIKNQIALSDWGVLLESADPKHPDSRWSIYTAQPIATLQTLHGKTTIGQKKGFSEQSSDPFKLIEFLRTTLFHDVKKNHIDSPFTGGALGYMAYELGYQLEKIKNSKKPNALDLPEIMFGFYDWALLYDNQNAKFYLLAHKTKDNEEALATLWMTRFNWLMTQTQIKSAIKPFKLNCDWSSNMDKQTYQEKFSIIQNGDCYQVNLAQRFQATYQGDEYQAYQALLVENRPPFAAFLRFPQQAILSLSPERFLKFNAGVVETKPIKGTSPRFKNIELDQKSQHKLLTSEKDRSENLMIVDLMRNDLGRVCQPGSVTVPKLFYIESFPAVHHLVSTVLGKLAAAHSTEDLLRACFPGGSITGAPKIRSMEIIAELESDCRQAYCGSIGYINGNGEMDTNISIRTLVCHEQKIYCWAGGALIADSDVEMEYQECFDKLSKILPPLTVLNKKQ